MTSEAPPLTTSEYFKLINSLCSKYGPNGPLSCSHCPLDIPSSLPDTQNHLSFVS